jgi:serine/threonine protein kinase
LAHPAGSKLGPYEILAPLGAGGMGEVYRARDARLGREVAIKVLPAAVASDADRLRRFAQEARAAGALNHPNLLAVYELDVHEEAPFLVCELLEGETLRDRLRRGTLPPRRAVEVGAQVARGLAAAHDQGILHRDLKPENLFLTRDGRAKILDFGLAKLLGEEPGERDTLTAPVTAAGALPGTAGYMSPEQARGLPLDARSDLFAFGVVLYELLAGCNPFRRDSRVETLHAILHDEPPELSTVVAALPPALERIVDRCLAKDPEARFHSAHDLAFALESLSGASDPTGSGVGLHGRHRSLPAFLPWSLAALAVLAALGIALLPRATPAPPPLRAELVPPPLTPRALGIALSPDGKALAVVSPATPGGKNLIWVRRLDSATFRPLVGTEQADAAYPFWSPDGRFLAFFSERKLRKVDARGGPVEVVCDAPAGRGGTWAADGTILFAPTGTSGIYRVPATGGTPQEVTRLTRPRESHRWPSLLPDGRHFLYLAWFTAEGRRQERVALGDLAASPAPATAFLTSDGSNAVFAPPRHLIFAREGRLLAQPFDLATHRVVGDPLTLGDEPVVFSRERGYAAVSAAGSGALAFRSEPPPRARLLWVDRAGRQLSSIGEAAPWHFPRLSPDGTRAVAFLEGADGRGDLWMHELRRSTAARLTFEPARFWSSAWAPDGKRIAFTSDRSGGPVVYLQTLGPVPPEPLITSATYDYAESWSRDGRLLFYDHQDPQTIADVWVLEMAGRQRRPLLHGPFRESEPSLSPDGRWLAYSSNEAGAMEVYVVPFPRVEDGKWQLSAGGGGHACWRADSRELYYGSSNGHVMAVTIAPGESFSAGPPRQLFAASPEAALEGELDFDAAADGEHFLVRVPLARQPAPISLLLGWEPLLRR